MRVEPVQLSVEILGPGLRVVRVAGVLDADTAPRLVAVVEAQLARPGCVGHIVVDLGEVRFFGAHDVDALTRVRDAARRAGVRVHLAGLTGREALLPRTVGAELAGFSVFPTVEAAQRGLAGRGAQGRPAVPSPGRGAASAGTAHPRLPARTAVRSPGRRAASETRVGRTED